MIHIAPPIKNDLLDTSSKRTLRNHLAYDFGRGDISAAFEPGACAFIERTGRDQCAPTVIIDDLRIDVIERTVNTKARASRCAHDALPHAMMDLLAVRIA